jgi:hypothetical protein
MKKSELKQLIKEEISKVLNEAQDQELFQKLKDKYFEGDKYDEMVNSKEFKSLPKDLQKKLVTIIRNNIRQNYY